MMRGSRQGKESERAGIEGRVHGRKLPAHTHSLLSFFGSRTFSLLRRYVCVSSFAMLSRRLEMAIGRAKARETGRIIARPFHSFHMVFRIEKFCFE